MAAELYCTTCGAVGKPKSHTPGSALIELILWLCFILPGLIYSMWRVANKKKICATCRAATVIPTGSPIAQQALALKKA